MGLLTPARKVITTQRPYANEEIHTMLQQSGLPYEPKIDRDIWRAGRRSGGSEVLKLPADKGFEVFIRVEQNKITVARVEKYYIGHILAVAVGLLGIYLLGDIGADWSIGNPALALVGGGAGGVVGFCLGKLISGAIGGKSESKWSVFFGKDDYTVEDIITAVAERLQRLID
jgi:hypothetical protein